MTQFGDINRNKVVAQIATGTYTGDGTIAQGITGLGFAPVYVKIVEKIPTDLSVAAIWETWDTMNDDDAGGAGIVHTTLATFEHIHVNDSIVSLDADGFTVGDRGADLAPNSSTGVGGVAPEYNYIAFG